MVRGRQQMAQLPDNVQLVTMQAGGNDAHFYDVARDCIFHHDQGKDYGGEYPEPGACLDAINISNDYITAGKDAGYGTWYDTYVTIADILGQGDQAKSAEFRLYVLGYAHFFNLDSPSSDWCNDNSFSLSWTEWRDGKRTKLSQPLRARINDLTTKLNDQILNAVNQINDPRVHYVSITEGFTGHRFCEAGGNLGTDMYGSDNVWFWNVSPRGLTDNDNDHALLQQEYDEMFNATYINTESQNQSFGKFDWSDLLNFEKGLQATVPFQGASPGIVLRPFHPTAAGHTPIKDSLKAAIHFD